MDESEERKMNFRLEIERKEKINMAENMELPMIFENTPPLTLRPLKEITAAIRWLEYCEEYRNEDQAPKMPESMSAEWLQCRLVKPGGGGHDLALAILMWAMGRDRPFNADEHWCNLPATFNQEDAPKS
jgi:hypothetical protein